MKVTMRVPYQISDGQKFADQSQCVPGQAYNLSELIDRFTRGERLLVHQRPIDVHPTDEDGNFTDGAVDETLDNILPQIEDRVDLDLFNQEIKQRKEEVTKRIKSKKIQKVVEKNIESVENEQNSGE